ncbi:MAG: endonuclease/exonuclease/phosphatase family protein [Cyanothece sp. SIO2G6]|nr:endonuclease/exonuclease/phosphatase family protein [Cyanothece sp. SIO2G6]
MAKIIVPGKYCPQRQRWEPLSDIELELSNPIDSRPSLTVATFNIWFSDYYFEERCAATLGLLQEKRPDIIVLQEVTPEFWEQVLRSPWIQQEYQLSDIQGDSVNPYGVLIMSRVPICDWQIVPLPSEMGRHLVLASSFLNHAMLTFASVHLESLDRAQTRSEQLTQIFSKLAPESHVIVAGDFNFCSSSEENQQLDPSYQDVWPLLHPAEPGFTEDTAINTMRLLYKRKQKQVRFDRMLLRSPSPGWQADAIALLGTEPISSATPYLFPSDHFGLMGTFSWRS